MAADQSQSSPIYEHMPCLCGLPSVTKVVMKQGIDFMRRYQCCPKEIGDQTRCAYFQFMESEQKDDEQPKCTCNLPCQTFQIRREGPNKGRCFLSCGLAMGHPERCDFWQLIGGPAYEPLQESGNGLKCFCGAPAVRGKKLSSGLNQGREFDRCAKKNCTFFRWN